MPDIFANVVPAGGCPHYVTRRWVTRWAERHGAQPVMCGRCVYRPRRAVSSTPGPRRNRA